MYKKQGESENKKHIFGFINDCLWFLSFPMLFICSLYMSWHVLITQDFFYGALYDHTELESFIDNFAPQNNFKPEFSQTDRQERVRVFSEVLKSVNHSGEGLESIQFYSAEGKPLSTLLRKPEIEHLQLVAVLINNFKQTGLVISFFSLVLFIFFRRYGIPTPDIRKVLLVYISGILILVALVMYVSPVKVFEAMHELIFPAGHQWFFYYQNSLMTTLMMAPKLFAYFFIIWMSVTTLLWLLFTYVFVRYAAGKRGT